jgi:hypothetical protein
MNSDLFLQLSPDFLAGVVKLHNLLIPLAYVFCGTSITFLAVQANREHALNSLWPHFVRTVVAVALLNFLPTWADMFQEGVTDLVQQCWGTKFPGSAYEAYEKAIGTKFGTGSIPSAANTIGGMLNEGGQAAIGGIKITHYGYPSDPNGNANDRAGIGAFDFDTAPGSLGNIGGLRAASLSPDVAAAYHINPGDSFNIQLAGGQTMSLVYADKTDPSLTGRIDLYDPNDAIGDLDGAQVVAVSSVQTPASNAPSTAGFNWGNPLESIFANLQKWSVWWLSIIALAIMVFMAVLQQFLYQIELAISPIFIGLMLIPALRGISSHFLLNLAGLLLWPFGWVISGLGTQFFVDLAINATNQQPAALYAVGGLAIWIVLAIWTISSAIAAPLIISKLLNTSTAGVIVMLGATVGRAASATSAPVSGSISSVATQSIVGGVRSIAAPNYAVRPMNKK